jgi:uncharacterized protein YbjT (DUF2867 family)
MDSKHAVEQHLRTSGVPHTIVAPVYFMDNLWNPWNAGALAKGQLPWPVSPARVLQQIPIADTLSFTVRVLEQRDALLGQRIEIASDELTGEQAAATLSALLGRQIRLAPPMPNPLFAWLERAGTHVNIAALRHAHPTGWHTFADWTQSQDWRPLTT